MQDTNVIVVTGRLTRDAELKYTNSGTGLCAFSLATNRRAKKGDEWVDEASFFDVTWFGKLAEKLSQYMGKGKQVCVTGSLKQERWSKDGENRSKVAIVADNVQLLGGKSDGGGSSSPDDFESDVPF